MKIGFIGLGNMGGPMAANLVKAGHVLRGFDPAGVPVPGVERASSAREAVAGCDAVVTMLPNGVIMRRVYDEIAPAAAKGALMIDSSTIDVDSARYIAAQAEAAELRPIDAPVSGGVGGAEGLSRRTAARLSMRQRGRLERPLASAPPRWTGKRAATRMGRRRGCSGGARADAAPAAA